MTDVEALTGIVIAEHRVSAAVLESILLAEEVSLPPLTLTQFFSSPNNSLNYSSINTSNSRSYSNSSSSYNNNSHSNSISQSHNNSNSTKKSTVSSYSNGNCNNSLTIATTHEQEKKPTSKVAVIVVVTDVSQSYKTARDSATSATFKISDLDRIFSLLVTKGSSHGMIPSNGECCGSVLVLIDPLWTTNSSGNNILTVSYQRQIIVVGRAAHLGICQGVRRDGVSCSLAVDTSRSLYCYYHKSQTDASKAASTVALPLRTTNIVAYTTSSSADKVPLVAVGVDRRKATGELGKRPATYASIDLSDDDSENENNAGKQKYKSANDSTASLVYTDCRVSRDGTVLVPSASSVFAFGAALHQQKLVQKQQEKLIGQHGVGANHVGIDLDRNKCSISKEVQAKQVNQMSRATSQTYDQKTDSMKLVGRVLIDTRKLDENSRTQVNNRSLSNSINKYLRDGSEIISGSSSSVSSAAHGLPTKSKIGASSSAEKNGITAKPRIIISNSRTKSIPAKIVSKPSSNTDGQQSNCNANRSGGNQIAAIEQSKQQALLNDIDSLLSKKSVYESDAQAEWFQDFSKKMDSLAKREYAQEKASTVHFFQIKAYRCVTCNDMNLIKENSINEKDCELYEEIITEVPPPVCVRKRHHVTSVNAIKQYFECINCRKVTNVISYKKKLLPKDRCFCGEFNWRPSGKQGTGPLSEGSGKNGAEKLTNAEKLVLSASDGTTTSDKLLMASRVGSLSE